MPKFEPTASKSKKKQLLSEGTYRSVGEFSGASVSHAGIMHNQSGQIGISGSGSQNLVAFTQQGVSKKKQITGNIPVQYVSAPPDNAQVFNYQKDSSVLGASSNIIYVTDVPPYQQEVTVAEESSDTEDYTRMSQSQLSGLQCGQQFYGKDNIFYFFVSFYT